MKTNIFEVNTSKIQCEATPTPTIQSFLSITYDLYFEGR